MASKTKSDKVTVSEKEIIKIAKDLAEKMLDLMGVDGKVSATVSEDLIKLEIDGSDLGLLIGHRGENLENLQLLLGIMVNKQLANSHWRSVVVDIGGWREIREESLRVLVEKEVSKLSSAHPYIELPPMPPTQRRSVHILVQGFPGLSSESVGEDPNRHIVIRKV